LDGVEEQADYEPDGDQVEDHLDCDEDAGCLAGRGDVPEADRGEDGDGEAAR
jgi:hypothetical protein